MHPKHKSLTGFKITDSEKGEFEAVFAVLGVKDHDGDVTLKGAFDNGAEVRVSAYNHKSWEGALPVGKGVISEDGDQVKIKGQFFMDTAAGRETFAVVKGLGDLQEWSYGYDTLEEEHGTHKGQSANIIKKQKVYEVSPVILGAGIGTRTTAIKSRIAKSDSVKQLYSDVYWQLRDLGRDHFHAGNGRYVSVQDFDIDDDFVIFRVVDDETKFVKLSFTRDGDGKVELTGDEEEVEVATSYVAAREKGKKEKQPTDTEEPGTKAEKPDEPEPEAKKEDEQPETKSDEAETEVKLEEQDAARSKTLLDSKLEGKSEQMKQLYHEIMDGLRSLGRERYNAGHGRWVYVEDFDVDDDYVIYCVSDEGSEEEYYKLSFTRDSDGAIELSDDEEEVERETSYVAVSDSNSDSTTTTSSEESGTESKGTLLSRLEDGEQAPVSTETKESLSKPGMKFSEHIEAVMTEIDELTERAASVVTLRAEKGKKRLGDESYALLKELDARMERLKTLLEQCNNDAPTDDPVTKAYLDEIARSVGH